MLLSTHLSLPLSTDLPLQQAFQMEPDTVRKTASGPRLIRGAWGQLRAAFQENTFQLVERGEGVLCVGEGMPYEKGRFLWVRL